MEKHEKKKSFWNRLIRHFINKDKRRENSSDKKLYSNSANTIVKIKDGLLQLLSQKDLSKISITNLVQLVGINRATFYLHYKNINDIVKDVEKDIFLRYNKIREKLANVDIYADISLFVNLIGEYMELDKEYMQAIISTNAFNSLSVKLVELANVTVVENFNTFNHIQHLKDANTKIAIFTGATICSCRQWLKGEDLKFDITAKYLIELGKTLFVQN